MLTITSREGFSTSYTEFSHIHPHLYSFLCITYDLAFTVHKEKTRSKFNPNAICSLYIRCGGVLSSS
jgi:hypothetical protein